MITRFVLFTGSDDRPKAYFEVTNNNHKIQKGYDIGEIDRYEYVTWRDRLAERLQSAADVFTNWYYDYKEIDTLDKAYRFMECYFYREYRFHVYD